jgi:hypothetical protein
VGHGFEVNDSPVPYGDLTALFGRLTGTLASGEPIDNIFYQGGGSYTGTITLIPEPSTALLFDLGLVGLGIGRRLRKTPGSIAGSYRAPVKASGTPHGLMRARRFVSDQQTACFSSG